MTTQQQRRSLTYRLLPYVLAFSTAIWTVNAFITDSAPAKIAAACSAVALGLTVSGRLGRQR